jgi:tetratricopeptide (TPR) repeat protein
MPGEETPQDASTGTPAPEDQANSPAEEAVLEAAKGVEIVVLPVACINEGKGAPLGMGVQRWWAQELSKAGGAAAAPVFTALADHEGRKVPALMVYQDAWTDERAIEGCNRFPNAKHALLADFSVEEEGVALSAKLVAVGAEGLESKADWSFRCGSEELPARLFDLLKELGQRVGLTIEHASWQEAFGTTNTQAMLSFLVGLGNLSALQGRCVPAPSDQLLNPLMDALNRDPEMEAVMEVIHAMTDILIQGQPDRAAVPLSMQALTIAAQKRPKDPDAWHHLALASRQLGDLPTAMNAFNQALNLAPESAAVATNFIQTLRSAGDNENALKVAKFSVERGCDEPPLLALLGTLLLNIDDFDGAEPFLRRAVDEGPVPSAFGDLANILWDRDEGSQQAEDRQDAMDLLRRAVQEQPHVAKSTLDMLLDLHEEEGLEDATKLLLEAGEKHSGNAEVLKAISNMYLDGDEPKRAIPFLEKIMQLPKHSLDDEAFARRNRLAVSVENFEELYDGAVDKVHSNEPAQQADAARFMRQIIDLDDRFWQPHLMLALAVRGTEGDAAALQHLTNAVRLRPNDAEIRKLMAAILRKQGRAAEAVEHLRIVVGLAPREIEPVINLASAMRDANMYEECRRVCSAALQMMPDNAEFKSILGSLPPPKSQQN